MQPQVKPKISAVILTFNEEKNIAYALRSVASWTDEIIVVDMYSEDRTVEIAQSFGAKTILHPRLGFQDPARSFAMDNATGDWIINLDADEIVPFKLSKELIHIAENDLADVCSIPRLNYIGGKPMLHSGWDPNGDRQFRFFKKGTLEFSPLVHVRPKPAPGKRLRKLTYPASKGLIHFNYLDSTQFLEKLNRYTSFEASQAFDSGLNFSFTSFFVRPAVEFVKRYIFFQGFRDGWNGFYYSFLMVLYKMTQAMKLRELKKIGSREDIRLKYQAIAEEEVRQFDKLEVGHQG
jgi:(heptosyl)LPS beta-1,4-glucosyltransferase